MLSRIAIGHTPLSWSVQEWCYPRTHCKYSRGGIVSEIQCARTRSFLAAAERIFPRRDLRMCTVAFVAHSTIQFKARKFTTLHDTTALHHLTKLLLIDTIPQLPRATAMSTVTRFKLIFFVPPSALAACKSAVFATGAGRYPGPGNYTGCCWTALGTGQFRPGNSANPNIGKVGELEEVQEARVETLCVGEDMVRKAVEALKR